MIHPIGVVMSGGSWPDVMRPSAGAGGWMKWAARTWCCNPWIKLRWYEFWQLVCVSIINGSIYFSTFKLISAHHTTLLHVWQKQLEDSHSHETLVEEISSCSSLWGVSQVSREIFYKKQLIRSLMAPEIFTALWNVLVWWVTKGW